MRDRRVETYRSAATALVESLEAVVRLSRWTGEEAAPEPLVSAAKKIGERLGAADRLVASPYEGPPADLVRVTAMRDAMKRLDVAYRAYEKDAASSPEAAREAATTLEHEVGLIDSSTWQ